MSSAAKRKAGVQAGSDAKKPKASGNIASFFGPPKSAAGNNSGTGEAAASGSTGPKFDKAKWVATLTAEQKELLKLEIDTLHESWLVHLKDELTTDSFLDLKRFLNRETASGKKWFPPAQDVYSWSRHTPFNTVKVVIVGQDPYHNHNQAHGLSFSVRPPTVAPPSLKNMFICLKNDYPGFTPPPRNGGLLTPWAQRGVLLLNASLTVRAHEAGSHANHGWERFTQKVIDTVAARRTHGVVFMAWGTPAGKRVQRVNEGRHLILRSVHPSPLSASRGFFTCRHFRLANEWLARRYGEDSIIDWALVEGTTTTEAKEAPKAKVKEEKAVEVKSLKAEGDAVVEEKIKKTEVVTKTVIKGDDDDAEKENKKAVVEKTAEVDEDADSKTET